MADKIRTFFGVNNNKSDEALKEVPFSDVSLYVVL